MDLGAPELLIILVIGLLVFGSNRLPKLARSLGQASKEFKSATTGDWTDVIPTASPAATTPAEPAPANVTPAAASDPPPASAPAPVPPAHDEPPSVPGHPAA